MTRSLLILFLFFTCLTNEAFARRTRKQEASIKQGVIVEGRQTYKQVLTKNTSEQIRVFWWNVAGEGFTKAPVIKVKKDQYPYWSQNGSVRGNLIAHVKNHQPDIIIIGEFPGSKLTDYEIALPSYNYIQQIPYYAGAKNFVTVFSRLPLIQIEDSILSIIDRWPGQISKNTKLANNHFWKSKHITDRVFQLFQIQSDEGEFILAPIHLVNPWPAYSKLYRTGNHAGAGALSYLKVAKEQMLKGKVTKNKNGETIYNPLQNQARDLIYQLDNLQLNDEPLLIVGDFNSPSRILPYGYPKFLDRSLLVPGLGHQLLAKRYKAPFEKHIDDVETIPTKFGGKGKPRVRIDKAFLSKRLKTAALWIFKYSGSDHYPIQLDVEIR
jgi:hypothetical protein